jgi:hypothetical protein
MPATDTRFGRREHQVGVAVRVITSNERKTTMLMSVLTRARGTKCVGIVLLGVACLVLLGAAGASNPTTGGGQWEYCRALHWDVGGEGRRGAQTESTTDKEPTWWFTPGCVPGTKVDTTDEDTVLKQLGLSGWQLVAVKEQRSVGGMQQTAFYFIRSKR